MVQSVEDLEWYHGGITRHVAEALLMANGREGSFLMRDVTGGQCISVRTNDAVKHFKIEVTADAEVVFAHGSFMSMAHLLQVFANQLILCADLGTMLILKYPYPKSVDEPDDYDQQMVFHSTIRNDATLADLKQKTKALPLASKSGFLTKQGGHIKTWKLRWFSVIRNEFSYFDNPTSFRPIRTLNLEECYRCNDCVVAGRENCFMLEFPDRTWLFSASSSDDLVEWTKVINWKIRQNSRES
uniref:PH domain-containing protein n=1 Tax=Ciona intestinalis TaxID=7719 RepID=H2XQM6_CIOIN